MRIIFYGTPVFAVPSLERIIRDGFEVVAVVTAPDKPAGRGMHLQGSPVKECALKHGIPVLQPTNLKSEEFMDQLRAYRPDLQVIIAFRMMPEKVWNFPPMGSLNLHASLLPDYRGAAPINRAIMNGETKTGLTTFFLKHEVDTGDMLLQKEVDILPEDNAGTLHDRLMMEGAELVSLTLQGIRDHSIKPVPQVLNPGHHKAPKIFTDDCVIDWNRAGLEISNQIRGLSPYPGAFTKYQGKILKIYSGQFEEDNAPSAGTFEILKDKFRIACRNGWYYASELQPEGKRRMHVRDFLNGLPKS